MTLPTWQPIASQLLAWGVDTAVRATLVLAGAFLLSLILRRASASARHALWTVTLSALLLLPILPLVLPSVQLPIPRLAVGPGASAASTPPSASESVQAQRAEEDPWEDTGGLTRSSMAPASGRGEAGEVGVAAGNGPAMPAAAPTGHGGSALEGSTRTRAAKPTGSASPISPAALLAAWLLGVAALAVPLASGVRRARRTCRSARRIREEEWLEALGRARRTVGVRSEVSLRLSSEVRTGMAGGLLHPVILLPDCARAWSRERRDVVLVHELVHLKRRDPLRKLGARLALATYWFHPLAWCAVRASSLAREEACDEAVLALGHRPSTYARHLVALSDPAPLPMPALARIDRSHLEKRIMKLLRHTPSSSSSRRTHLVVALGAAWALLVAAAVPGAEVEVPLPAVTTATDTLPPPPVTAPIPPSGVSTTAVLAPPPTVAAPADIPPAADPGPGLPSPPSTVPPPPSEPATGHPGASPARAPTPPLDPGDGCRIRADGPDFEDGRDFGVREGGGAVIATGDRFVQRSLDDFMLCLRTRGGVRIEDGRIEAMPEGAWLVLAVRGEGLEQRLEVRPGADGLSHAWFVDGEARTFDDEAMAWRDAMLEVLDAHAGIARARGDEARLRGEAARVRGEEARLRGEIAQTRGEEARIRGEVALVGGREASVRGEVARIRGEEARLRGEIARARGEAARAQAETSRMEVAITSLEQARRVSTDTVTRARLEAEIEEARRAVVETRRRMNEDDVERRVAEVRQRLEDHREQTSGRLAELEELRGGLDMEERVRQIENLRRARETEAGSRIQEVEAAIAALDTEGRVRAIQERIEALDTEARVRALQESSRAAEERLRELIGRVR